MPQSLDHLLERLAAAEPDRSLSQLEPGVWRRIEAGQSVTGLSAPLHTATVALALLCGIAVGGATATAAVEAPKEMAVFALHPALAPATLLEGGR